jgi:hypothetical protein
MKLAVCGLLLWLGSSAMQAQEPGSRGPGSRGSGPADGSTFSMSLGRAPRSLDEMIADSKLIVEVTVISAFPATRNEMSGTPAFTVSTDFVLAPQRVLKGQLAADRFVVRQHGGQLEGRRHFSNQYPGGLMSPGQRYILFLNDPDSRSPVQPQRDALVRFETTSVFLGVVLVEDGKVELSKNLAFRDTYNGMSATRFMDEIARD